MRIIGYIEHPWMKITVFKMDDKISVKFESGQYEQTYKFRSGEGVEGLEDVRHFADAQFISAVESILTAMHQAKLGGLKAIRREDSGTIFEEII